MKRITFLVSVFVLLISLTLVSQSYIQFNTSVGTAIPDALWGSAVAYYDQSIFLIGGADLSNQPVSSVYIYSNGSWHLGPSLPFALQFASAVVCNGNLYVVGGVNSSSIFGGILEYTGNGWKVISNNMPIPVYAAIVFAYQDKIYVIGGMNYSGNQLVPPSNAIQVYNLNTGAWSIIGYAPETIAFAPYYFNGSVLFVVGGLIYPGTFSNIFYEYFPQNNSWVEVSTAPFVTSGASLGYYNGVLYLIGGLTIIQGQYMGGIIAYYYNNSWHILKNTFEKIPTEYSSYIEIGNTMYILGGLGPQSMPTDAMQEVTLLTPPPRPTIIYAISGNETVTLKWYDTNASGYYFVYWSNPSQVFSINVGNTTSYTITHLVDGKTYHIEIIAYNSLGNSTPSQIVNVTPVSVPNPPIVKVKLGDRNATITWFDNFNGGYPILGYYVLVNGKLVYFGNSTTYTLVNLNPGELYEVDIIAFNELGNSSPAVVSFVAISKANLTIEVFKENSGFLISWNSTTNATYVLTVTQGYKLILNVSLTNNSYLVKVPFGVYNVTLKAKNKAGVSTYTFTVIYYLPPSSPIVNWSIQFNKIYLNWSKSNYASYYLIYDNNVLVENTTQTSAVINLSLGVNTIKIVAANDFYKSAPYVISGIINHFVIVNSTVINEQPPPITYPVAQAQNTDVPANDVSSLDLKSAIIVILVFIMALLMIWAVVRERSDNY